MYENQVLSQPFGGRCPAVLPHQPHPPRTGYQHFIQDNLWKDGEKHGIKEINKKSVFY